MRGGKGGRIFTMKATPFRNVGGNQGSLVYQVLYHTSPLLPWPPSSDDWECLIALVWCGLVVCRSCIAAVGAGQDGERLEGNTELPAGA